MMLMFGCATPISQDDIQMLAWDLKDIAEASVVYDLIENPEHKEKIIEVRDRLIVFEAFPTEDVTIESLMLLIQQLPIDELKSPEAQLGILAGKLILRRVDRSIDLGLVNDLKPLVTGLREGMDLGLGD